MASAQRLPAITGWVFMAAGAVMVVGGIILVFDDPGGFALIAFGLAFAGAGWLARRLFATPPGKQAVLVATHDLATTSWHGQAGRRAQATVIHVDDDAGEAEIAAARAAWRDEQFRQRPDWVAGRIEADAVRHGGLLQVGAILWIVFALAAAGAAWLWDEFFWLVAGVAALIAAALWIAVARLRLHARKFGASHFVPERRPAELGGRLVGEIETGVGKANLPRDGFRVALSCVHRWEETVRSGSDRRTVRRREVLWREEQTSAGHSTARHANLIVKVDFALPADRPATTLGGGSDGILWELEVRAALPGLDYAATFEVPVLAPAVPDSS